MNLFQKPFKKHLPNDTQLRPLFYMQEELDNKINSRFELDDDIKEEHKLKKIVSFRVEVAELLNATRLQKYWSVKPMEPREKILEEYVDGLHFLISIGIDKKVKNHIYKGKYDATIYESDIIWLFEQMFIIPWGDLKKDDFSLGLEMYLKLGDLLGFSWEDIKEAYVDKNLENHERQNTNY